MNKICSLMNPWYNSYHEMSKELKGVRCSNSHFARFQVENGHEYYREKTSTKHRIYRVQGWCTKIKYEFLKRFSSEWTERLLKIRGKSEKILVPKEQDRLFCGELLNYEQMFVCTRIEQLAHFRGQDSYDLYQEVEGKELLAEKHIYRSRSVFSWMKMFYLKICSSTWEERSLKIWGISEKILTKKEDADQWAGVTVGSKPIFE